MRRSLLPIIVVAVTLAAPPISAQPSDRELREYVRDAWGVASLTDEVAREMFEADYEGIPFRSWVSFYKASDVLEPLGRQDYRGAAEAAGEIAANRVFDRALSQAGLSGVSATAQLATLPIELGLRSFQRAVADRAFESQAALYFEARRNHSASEIMNAQPGRLLTGDQNPITKDDQGWLYRRRAQHVPDLTPQEMYAYAEAMWLANNSIPDLRRSQSSVAAAFVGQLAGPTDPDTYGVNVNNVFIGPDLSRSDVMSIMGRAANEFEPWETDLNGFLWNMGEDGVVSAVFNRSGILQTVNIGSKPSGAPRSPFFAIVGGQRIGIGETSLSEIQGAYPNGCMGFTGDNEGYSFKEYHVTGGPGGAYRVSFSVEASWDDFESEAELIEQPLRSIQVHFVPFTEILGDC